MIENRDISLNGTAGFQALHPGPAGRLGKTNLLGELGYCKSAIISERGQDLAVHSIKSGRLSG
jgi:hypothetical protein